MGPRPTVKEFVANRNLVAMRVTPEELPGLVRKALQVPANCAAMAVHADGSYGYFPEGTDVPGRQDIVLAKSQEIECKMIFPDLRCRDGYSVSATCALLLKIHTERGDLFKDFGRTHLPAAGVIGTSDLKSAIAADLRRILTDLAAESEGAKLHRQNLPEPLLDRFQVEMERALFGTGVRMARAVSISFTSYDFEQEVQERDEREKSRARQESEIRRKEDRLKRLQDMMADQRVQDLLQRIPDERLRAVVTARLMSEESGERNPTELLKAVGVMGDEAVEMLYRALEGNGPGPDAGLAGLVSERAERILLVTSNLAIELDPARPSEPAGRYSFPVPLRSVRLAPVTAGWSLLGGGKTVVYARPLGVPDAAPAEYPLPAPFEPRGGINAMAVLGDRLFASHSEFGLAMWNLGEPGVPGARILDRWTLPNRTTRAVAAEQGDLYFATGPTVVRVPQGDPSVEPVVFVAEGAKDVTALAVAGTSVFAGTACGQVYRWNGQDAEAAPEVLAHRKEPIAALRIVRMRRVPHVLYTAHDTVVHARMLGQALEMTFESGGAGMSFMDAASDVVCAVDGTGSRLFLWYVAEPARPFEVLDCWRFAQKPVLDVWMRRGATASP